MTVRHPLSRRAFLWGMASFALSFSLIGCSAGRYRPLDASPQLFTPKEVSILDAVCLVIIPDYPGFPSIREVKVAKGIDALFAKAHPALQSDLRQLLDAFEEMTWLSLRFERFTSMQPAIKADYLRGWQHSRLPMKRQGFQALKKLAQSVYYMDPRTWPAIAYEGPWVGRMNVGEIVNLNPHVLMKFEALNAATS